MKRIFSILFFIVLCGIVYFISCGPDPASSDDKDITGTISGTVMDTSGKVLSGVSITTDTGGYTSVTDTVGHYTIPYVKAGTYSLTFTKADYADTTVGNIAIVNTEDVINVNMMMRDVPAFGAVYGTVRDSATNVPLLDVPVQILPLGQSVNTDANGNYLITGIPVGIYSVTAHTTYRSNTIDSVIVVKNDTTLLTDTLRATSTQGPTGAVFGIVCDSTTGELASSIPIIVSPVGKTGLSNASGQYLITMIPAGTYSVKAYLTHHSNTVADIVVLEDDTTFVTDTIRSVLDPMVEHDIYGDLTGNLSDIAGVTATVTGDSIPEDSPVITSLTWLPISKRYTGFVYVPLEGLVWQVEVRIFNSDGRLTGYQKMAFDAGAGDIALPAFDAENVKPTAVITAPDSVRAKSTFTISSDSSFPGMLGTIVTREWCIGADTSFTIVTKSDTIIQTSDTELDSFAVILRVTNDSNWVNVDTSYVTIFKRWEYAGQKGFSRENLNSDICVASDNTGRPYALFNDRVNNLSTLSLKRLEDSTWIPVGIEGFTDYRAFGPFSLAIDKSDIPYVAFREEDQSSPYDEKFNPVVKRYNGSDWEIVGSKNFTGGLVTKVFMELLNNDTPYVAIIDSAKTNGKIKIMRFNGVDWENVAETDGKGIYAFVLDKNANAFIQMKKINDDNVYLLKYDGIQWETIYKEQDEFPRAIILDSNGCLHICIDEVEKKFTVKKYQNQTWQTVGNTSFTSGEGFNVSLSFDPFGTLYIAYSVNDVANVNDCKLSVMRFNNNAWESVGAEKFARCGLNKPTTTFDLVGTPFVAFPDKSYDRRASVMVFK